ncbi:MAG: tetratricopeptide repeat protein [Treponemataceae bacterium]|nr:tetratricopeptide repeat protein [Treponemataceae bacterium]
MASKSPLQKARKYFNAGKYPKVISLLEPLVLEYRESFDFFFLLGTACLYVEDIGGAEAYYKTARRIRVGNPDVMRAQGVLYLRLGDISRALELYLGVLDALPGDAVASDALEFIRRNSDPEKMEQKIRSGALKKFYPKRGLHPAVLPLCAAFLVLAAGCTFFAMNYRSLLGLNGARADLSYLELSADEKSNPVSADLSSESFRYILTKEEVVTCYNDAKRFFQQHRDNEARRCINKLLLSNADSAVKLRAEQLAEHLEEPRFDTVTDNYSVRQVLEDIYLYNDCWVVWSGRVSNVEVDEKFLKCVLLVGYENLDRIDGSVTLVMEQPVSIDAEKALKILCRITVSDGQLILRGKTVYQPVDGSSLL